jgi:allantoate deiminase
MAMTSEIQRRVMKSGEKRKRAEKTLARCGRLASFSEDQGSLRRTFLSPPMIDCHREIASWMEPLGVPVRVDSAGNLRASYPGIRPGAPRLMIGSHLDTVPNAGAYDGMLGVVLAVSLLETLGGRKLPFGIEVVGFSEEEGVRFGVPFIGSRALVGRIDEELLRTEDACGISIRQAIENFGLNLTEIPQFV